MQFSVQNMTCGHCVKAVTHAIQQADPAAQVNVDLSTKSIEVESDLLSAKIIELLAEEGYPAQLLEE